MLDFLNDSVLKFENCVNLFVRGVVGVGGVGGCLGFFVNAVYVC